MPQSPDSTFVTASAVPARSARRATARRASNRRAAARERKDDVEGRIVEFLKDHPRSTTGDIAKGSNANRATIAAGLSQLGEGVASVAVSVWAAPVSAANPRALRASRRPVTMVVRVLVESGVGANRLGVAGVSLRRAVAVGLGRLAQLVVVELGVGVVCAGPPTSGWRG